MLSTTISSITGKLLLGTLAAVSVGATPAQAPASAPAAAVKTTLGAPIYVVGFSVRTTNTAEAKGDGEIPKLWNRFFQENLGAQIPHRIGQGLIVVYSDYATDEKGEFSYLLGTPVDSIEGLSKDLAVRTIPAGPYAVVTTPRGRPQDVMPATWMKIWQMPESELGGKRSFSIDYETYDDFSDPNNMQVSIYLGLKPAAK
jgi:predicted transcriptional regulator YdeE